MPIITRITIPAIFFLLLAFFRILILLLPSAVGGDVALGVAGLGGAFGAVGVGVGGVCDVGGVGALGAVGAAGGVGAGAVGVGGVGSAPIAKEICFPQWEQNRESGSTFAPQNLQ